MRVEQINCVVQNRILLHAEQLNHRFNVFWKRFESRKLAVAMNLLRRRDADFFDHRQKHLQIVQLNRRRYGFAAEQQTIDARA